MWLSSDWVVLGSMCRLNESLNSLHAMKVEGKVVSTCAADETDAVVLDVGAYNARAGYAGEDAPKAVFPSVSPSYKLRNSAVPTLYHADSFSHLIWEPLVL